MTRPTRLAPAALYLAILLAWEVLPRAGVVPRLFVPSLSEALGALGRGHREFLGSLPTTVGEIVAAYALACGGGILAGQLVAASPAARRMLLPVIRSETLRNAAENCWSSPVAESIRDPPAPSASDWIVISPPSNVIAPAARASVVCVRVIPPTPNRSCGKNELSGSAKLVVPVLSMLTV